MALVDEAGALKFDFSDLFLHPKHVSFSELHTDDEAFERLEVRIFELNLLVNIEIHCFDLFVLEFLIGHIIYLLFVLN